jgi:hypothetical protein
MKVDLKEAARKLKFNEQALLDFSHVIINSKANGRNIFADFPQACDYSLPQGMQKGSIPHKVYLMDMSILDLQINSDGLHNKALELYKNKPEFFNPQKMFDEDKNHLYIKELKGIGKTESSVAPVPASMMNGEDSSEAEALYDAVFENGNGGSKSRKPMQVVVAPTIDKILNKELKHGFHYQLSNRIFQTYRKLVRNYDGDPENVFKSVKDYDVALRRLDVGKTKPDIKREVRNETFPRFSGFGPAKTAPLLIHKYIREGVIKDLDRRQVPVPMDRWEVNTSIKKGITDIGDVEVRKDAYIRDLQALYHDTFLRNGIDPIDFHEALWLLGSEGCIYSSCDTRKTKDGKDSICPFVSIPTMTAEGYASIDPCSKFLDIDAYRKRGVIKASYFKAE